MFGVFAAVGPFGTIFESIATAIGTGIVIGGFVGATAGMIAGWSRKQVESHALRDGYFGALLAIGGLALDLFINYAGLSWTI